MSPVHCLFCDHHNPVGSKFCNACGDALHLQPCNACGAVDGRTATHCYQCGKPFAAGSVQDAADALRHGVEPGLAVALRTDLFTATGADFWRNPRSRSASVATAAAESLLPPQAVGAPTVAASDIAAAPQPTTNDVRGLQRRLPTLLVAGLIGLAGLGAYAFHRQTTAKGPSVPAAPAASSLPTAPVAPAAPPVVPTTSVAPAAPTTPAGSDVPASSIAPASSSASSVVAPAPTEHAPDSAAPSSSARTDDSERNVRPTRPDSAAVSTRSSAASASRRRPRTARSAPAVPQRARVTTQHRTGTAAGGVPMEATVRSMNEPVGHETPPTHSPQPPLESDRAIPWMPPRLYQG